MKFKIKGTPYTRDLNNMAVLCTDRRQKMQYEQQKAIVSESKHREMEMYKMKNEISELKSMLEQLMRRGQDG